jgi:hypothetical protein
MTRVLTITGRSDVVAQALLAIRDHLQVASVVHLADQDATGQITISVEIR